MLKNVYVIYDQKVQAYLTPFFMPTHGSAIRAIADLLNQPEHEFARHLEDYTLYTIGKFDDTNAEFSELCKISLGTFLELKEPEK